MGPQRGVCRNLDFGVWNSEWALVFTNLAAAGKLHNLLNLSFGALVL